MGYGESRWPEPVGEHPDRTIRMVGQDRTPLGHRLVGRAGDGRLRRNLRLDQGAGPGAVDFERTGEAQRIVC
jgi:hypothetical protein